MKCWICGYTNFSRHGGIENLVLRQDNFKITDANYGLTLPRYICRHCGFIQCDTEDVTAFYERLKDDEYIDSGQQRALQFHKLLDSVKLYISPKGRLLDIGAGSGIFMQEAMKIGYEVTGIEPSEFLASKAIDVGLNVIQGTFPNDCPDRKYDVIFMTDVIEHIVDPLPMLMRLPDYLAENGKVIVTTPDVSSLLARVLGKRWWHYRVAHVGYYNKKTLGSIMEKAGFIPIEWKHAKWCFSAKYLIERLVKYIPCFKPLVKVVPKKLMVPINLFDSWLAIFAKCSKSKVKK